jgi:HlyD family secretion protein
MKKVLITLIVLVVLAGFGYTLFFLYEKSKEQPIVYNTQKASVGNVIKKTVATGSVVPRNEILIKPQISGVIEEIFVEPGQQVKVGDRLARIKIIPNMVAINTAENRVNRAKLERDNAQIDFDRNKKLYDNGVVAYAEFQRFDLALKNALQEVEAAEDNYQIVTEGVAKSMGTGSNTVVRATGSGMVLDVPVKEGNSVIEANNFNEGTTIASIADMEDLIFEGKVDESEVGKIREGMELIMTIGAIDGQRFTAILEYIAPKGEEENGAIQFPIRAAVKLQSDQFIRAGYSANADVVLDRRDSVLTLNESLIQYEDNGAKAFVEVATGDQRFEKREVKVGLSDGIITEVISGVDAHDAIKDWNRPQKR